MIFPDSKLWTYSTQMYQLAEVESSCLALQNSIDADVNILLYCCWLADQGMALDTDDIPVLVNATRSWQNSVIKPLREARKLMKHQIIALPPEMREQTLNNIAEMELNGEHMAQLALEKALRLDRKPKDTQQNPAEIAAHNLMLYCRHLDAADRDIMPALAELLNGVFQDAETTRSALMPLAQD